MPGTSSNSSSFLNTPFLLRNSTIDSARSREQSGMFLTRSSAVQVFRLNAIAPEVASTSAGAASGTATGLGRPEVARAAGAVAKGIGGGFVAKGESSRCADRLRGGKLGFRGLQRERFPGHQPMVSSQPDPAIRCCLRVAPWPARPGVAGHPNWRRQHQGQQEFPARQVQERLRSGVRRCDARASGRKSCASAEAARESPRCFAEREGREERRAHRTASWRARLGTGRQQRGGPHRHRDGGRLGNQLGHRVRHGNRRGRRKARTGLGRYSKRAAASRATGGGRTGTVGDIGSAERRGGATAFAVPAWPLGTNSSCGAWLSSMILVCAAALRAASACSRRISSVNGSAMLMTAASTSFWSGRSARRSGGMRMTTSISGRLIMFGR